MKSHSPLPVYPLHPFPASDSLRCYDNDIGHDDDYIYDVVDGDISSVLDSIGKYLEVGFKKSKVGHDINNRSLLPPAPPQTTTTMKADANYNNSSSSPHARLHPVDGDRFRQPPLQALQTPLQPLQLQPSQQHPCPQQLPQQPAQQHYIPPAATAGMPLQLKVLTTTSLLPHYCLITTSLLHHYYLTITSLLPHYYLTNYYPLSL